MCHNKEIVSAIKSLFLPIEKRVFRDMFQTSQAASLKIASSGLIFDTSWIKRVK